MKAVWGRKNKRVCSSNMVTDVTINFRHELDVLHTGNDGLRSVNSFTMCRFVNLIQLQEGVCGGIGYRPGEG